MGGWLNTEPVWLWHFSRDTLLIIFPVYASINSTKRLIRNHIFFRTPALFEPFANAANPAIDEWTLSLNLAANGQLQSQLVNHYQTFIVSSKPRGQSGVKI